MKIKKYLGMIAIALLIALPIKANAATTSVSYNKVEESNGRFKVNIVVNQTGGNTMNELSASMKLENAEFVQGSEIGNNGWSVNVSGDQIYFSNSVAETASEFTIGSLEFISKGTAGQNCSVVFTCLQVPKTVELTKTTENPKTGNFMPYAVIAVGVALAGGVYYVTRKNTKLYKI